MRRFAQAQRAFQGSPSRRRGAIFRLPALSRAAEGIDSMRMSSAVPAPLSEEARARGRLKLLVELWRFVRPYKPQLAGAPAALLVAATTARKSVVAGKRGAVRVHLGWRRMLKKNITTP